MSDVVNHPPHYEGRIECIGAIEAALGPEGFGAYLRGQVMKYMWRMDKKGHTLQDAQKAEWYLRRLIACLSK